MPEEKKSKPVEASFAVDIGNIVVGIIGLLAGVVLGELLPPLKDDPLNPSFLPNYLIALSVIVLVAGVGAFLALMYNQKRENQTQLSDLTKQTNALGDSSREIHALVERTVARQATLLPRSEVYKDLAEAISEAKVSVRVITYLAVDWDTGVRNWGPNAPETPFREDFYAAVNKAIANDAVEYERVWQIPPDRTCAEAMEQICSDEFQKEEVSLINKYAEIRADKALFKVATQLTTASFILIDGTKLFFNIDLYNHETKKWDSPYMLFIKDATGEAFEPLKGVIARLKPCP